jgi:fatty-acyl-CoA synthase
MTMHSWINRWAKVSPEKPAIIFADQQYTYAELAQGIGRLAAVFQHDFGIRAGDRIAFLGNNSPRLIETLFACAQTEAILVPLNWRLAVPELLQILTDAEVALLIVGEDRLETAAAIAEQLENCRMAHAYRGDHLNSWPCLQELQNKGETAAVVSGDLSARPVLILYTSGTTGRPKGVVLTQAALACCVLNSQAMHDMTADDHILAVLPMFHAGGLCIQTLPALFSGASITLHREFDPEAVLASIASGLPTLTALVPAQITPMLAHPDWSATDMSQLRSVTTGSTFVPESCVDAWFDRGVIALQVYGATETCAVAIHQSCSNVAESIGSVGYAAVHCSIRIVGADGRELPRGQQGEFLIKGANVFTQYWHHPQATDKALIDGWFHTGDIGCQRDDGAYTISDRKADLIISGGENIYSAELEAILDLHSEIVEAAVVSQQDARWGEVPVAIVVTTADSRMNQDDVLALFRDRLARFKHPQRVILVDKLPRNAMGKIEKFELRKQIAGYQES